MVLSVTDENFEAEVLRADGPVVVDFWAEWCGPCKALSPALQAVSEELSGQVKIAKVNIEDAPEAPVTYGVRGVPTLIVFKDGKPVDTHVGALSQADLKAWVQGNL